MHKAQELIPAEVPYLPAAQSEHVPLPLTSLYFPAMHKAQELIPAEVPYLPAAQFVHAALPVTALNFPAVHAVQILSSGPEKPALQRQGPTPTLLSELLAQAIVTFLLLTPAATEPVFTAPPTLFSGSTLAAAGSFSRLSTVTLAETARR